MPRGSEELTRARREEIINACAELYKTMSLKDITIQDIGAKTSFSRTSIYNYFQTKEEIFLALLEREHNEWNAELRKIMEENPSLSVEEFADKLARSLEKRETMLKLMSMNIYDMEVNSRLENLTTFKQAYSRTHDTLCASLKTFFPNMNESEVTEFMFSFFPFLFGVYPYTYHTEKQLEAMERAGVEEVTLTIYEITKPFIERMLKTFK